MIGINIVIQLRSHIIQALYFFHILVFIFMRLGGGAGKGNLRRLRQDINHGYDDWLEDNDEYLFTQNFRPMPVSRTYTTLANRREALRRQADKKTQISIFDPFYSRRNGLVGGKKEEQMHIPMKPNIVKKAEENKKQNRPKKQINKDYKFKGDLGVANDILPEGDLKNLKRLCANLIENAENILIKFSKTKPTLLFQYSDNDERKSIHLRDVIRGNKEKKVPVEPTLIFRTFDRLYEQVPEEYWLLGKFGLVMAHEKKLYKFKSLNIVKDADRLKLYYGTGPQPGYMNFSLFQQELFYVEFTGKYIEQNKQGNPNEFQIFEKFQKFIFENPDKDDAYEAVDQVDSGAQGEQQAHKNPEKQSDADSNLVLLKQLENRIKELVEKDLSDYEALMEKKNDKCLELSKNGSPEKLVELQRLSEEVSEMDTYLENFKKIKSFVVDNLRLPMGNVQKHISKLQMHLKRLILAQKQMSSRLPILGKKPQIFRMLDNSNLFILEGETGSGKSTQLPQLLCQYYKIFQNQNVKPVLITQPRKLATRSLAERVASEMEEEIHGFVEYQASCNNRAINPKAKIIFKLDRLVLDEMTVDPLLSNYSCLVIDEAHERTISIDVILGRVKNILAKRKDFKIIVTSASLDTGLFKEYFKKQILKVQGRMFPVTELFRPLEFIKDIKSKIERILIGEILQPDMTRVKEQYQGHILAFCSGIDEINALGQIFQNRLSNKNFKILSLHGRLSAQEQKQVFQESKRTKIIFATRIAETSITINGVKVVIDPGMDREMVYDQKHKISSMQLKNISDSSAKQRAGRAGRTNSGFCFRLYSEEQKRKMNPNKTPQIQNMALDSVVLRLKSLLIPDVISFDYLSPPDPQGLKISLETMRIIGCLDNKGQITEIGKLLVKIPIEPFLSRAIIQSIFFKYHLSKEQNDKTYKMGEEELEKLITQDLTESTIRTLAMLINSSSLFYVKQCQREDAEKHKFQEYPQMSGDFQLFLKIYSQYLEYFRGRRNEELRVWANQNYISIKTLHQVRELHQQIHTIIKNFNFKQKQFDRQLKSALTVLKGLKSSQQALLACLVPSFVTNLCLYSENQQIGYTLISQQIPLHLYGTSILSLQGNTPKWILCYDLYTNQNDRCFCKAAQAINFDFLKLVVREEIKNYYELQKAEKQNPFYRCIKIELPSLIFMDVLADYRKRNNYLQLEFLNKFTFIFNEDQNCIDIYYLLKKFQIMNLNQREQKIRQRVSMLRQSKNDYRLSNKPELIIESYLQEIKAKYNKILAHQYIGQINIKLDNGFNIKAIDFTKCLYTFKVQVKGEIAELLHYLCSPLGKLTRYDEKMIFEIEGQKNREQFKKKVQVLRSFVDREYQFTHTPKDRQIKYYEEVVDHRHKIPKAKLLLTFYAGQASKNNIFLNYKLTDDKIAQKALTEYMVQLFATAKLKIRDFKLLHPFSIRTSKNLTGINISFLETTDQFELERIFQKIDEEKSLGYAFEMPQSIIKFRQPESPYCFMTDHQWEKKIRQLFATVGGENQKLTIRVWGTYKRGNNEQQNKSKHIRVNMRAQIESFSFPLLEKFKNKYDGKIAILGTEKVHMTYEFNQTIAAPTYDIFSVLSEDFYQMVDLQIKKNPKITIETSSPKLFRDIYKIFISIRGQKRDDFFEPSRRLGQLFSPIKMRIEPKYSYRLDWKSRNQGTSILDFLEEKHNYKVYFIFDKKTSTLKIFCNEEIGRNIQKQITEKLEEFQIKSQEISYRGKSLQAVLNLIQEYKTKIEKNKTLEYEILYGRREVILTAEIDTLIEIKNKVTQLQSKAKEDCLICCGLQQQPYKLLNCNHSFCMLCLVECVKETSDVIVCPSGCGNPISIYDIRRILSEDQFNKVCDRQVSKYIEKNPKFHGCFTPDCQQIFLREESEKENSFECQLCGKDYCFTCKQSHKGLSCSGGIKDMKKLGIKQCPRCMTGIQKNGGCNHMTCKNCKAHICWKCLKVFQVQNDCYNHLVKVCGGIFDPGYVQQDPGILRRAFIVGNQNW